MKKSLLILVLSAVSLAAQTSTLTLTLTVPSSFLLDLNTHYLGQVSGVEGSLISSMDATTVSQTINISQSALVSQPPAITVGAALLIEHEACVVTSMGTLSAGVLPVTIQRASLPLATMASHAAGVPVMLLVYPTPWVMFQAEALLAYQHQISMALGLQSATFAATVAGSVQ